MEQKKEINSISTSGTLQPEHFSGNYTSIGGDYFQHSEHFHIVKIRERKNPTIIKPALFMILKTIGGQYEFISSLYPLSAPNTYTGDLNKFYFKLIKTETNLIISKR